MADFRKWLYAFAVVTLLAGFTVPASAQSNVSCTTFTTTTPVVRSQGYAELVADYVLSCTGGTSTASGVAVPAANVTVFLNTNITSKLVGNGGAWSEALLLVDDPGGSNGHTILDCGNTGAPDTGPSGPGVCSIVSDGQTNDTYNGVGDHPNVFQGRPNANNVIGTLNNSVQFLGVPLDPPGTNTRILRITNVRADAEAVGLSQIFVNSITMNVAINSNTGNGSVTNTWTVNNSTQVVAYVQNGINVSSSNPRLDFVQCSTENGKLDVGVPEPYIPVPLCPSGSSSGGGSGICGGLAGGGNNTIENGAGSPVIRFAEGFATSFKPKNFAEITGNGTQVNGGSYAYNGLTTYPPDANQSVPGAVYNSESGFEYSGLSDPAAGITAGGGIGAATQGTRLAFTLTNVPNGANVWVPPVVYLYRQGTFTGGPLAAPNLTSANYAANGGVATGVMVLTATAADGSGAYTPAATGTNLTKVSITGGTGLVVYEVLFADPLSQENADVPLVVSFTSNLSSNPPAGLPVPNQIATVSGGFAPFYSTAAARQPSSVLPVPRFIAAQPSTSANVFSIEKCACNILFPFVTVQAGFDTGIAIANTTADPSGGVPGVNGFVGVAPQQGTVTFYYYGTSSAAGGAPPASQISAVVPAGQVLTYDLYSGGGSVGGGTTGSVANGLTNSAAGFQGYVIAQSSFQYCHGFAFISNLGDPTGGISEGYLGIVLDAPRLPRTVQAAGEQDGN